ncbi:MAG: hypothetical protein Q4D61_07740 [Cardiobacteriaceae bacterium]|nr:hypothetical protein [Cardiobacteriaceae bacterium]
MSRSQPHYLKSRKITFPTKYSFKKHLQAIRHRAEESQSGIITDENDILDLKDFIQDYCDKSENLQNRFDLDNCYFVVKKSRDYSTKCLFIVDNESKYEEQISTENFGNPPTPLQNFRSFCTYTISGIKRNIREQLAKQHGRSFDEVDLWHQKPTTKQIVDEFIRQKNISDHLDKIISPNHTGGNVPYLMPEYEYLQQELLIFYEEKASTDLLFRLREAKR